MRPAPIPAEAVWDGAVRVVFAAPNGDLTDPDVAPVEVVADRSYDGTTPRFSARCVLEPGDLEKLQAGGHVWVSFYGTVVPFSVEVTGPATRRPQLEDGSAAGDGFRPGLFTPEG